jgi:hypothetical protein
MTNTDWRFIKYLDSIEHEYGYMLQTSAYVCPGWMILIQDMLRELDARHDGKEDHPVLTTIKEKFGTLRVYGYNIDDTDQAIIDKYEKLSATICSECGNPGKLHVKNMWLYVACAEHANGGWPADDDE